MTVVRLGLVIPSRRPTASCRSVRSPPKLQNCLGRGAPWHSRLTFATLAPRLVATQSSNERVLPAVELAERARAYFVEVEVVAGPAAALARAHELGDSIVVTGSLYLLADLERWPTPATA